MNIILFDEADARMNLLPLTFTRPIAEIRCGILTFKEKWQKYFPEATISYLTEDYLQEKFPLKIEERNFLINARFFPTGELAEEISRLDKSTKLYDSDEIIIAVKLSSAQLQDFLNKKMKISKLDLSRQRSEYDNKYIRNVWDIFTLNHYAIEQDFQLLTEGKTSAQLNSTNTHIGNNLFIEEGAKINGAIINSSEGPVYIGKNAEIMEGSLIRGPFALCDNATLKMGAKIYGATTIGPHCKVGGEVNNSVIFGYSNKAHDGFLGNSVLGEWCNIGADSNNSNLKNNYAQVGLWNYKEERFVKTGLQFCGLIMGDHSKCGINTMFNTGTVVGVSANIFGAGFPRNFIPSFTWGGPQGFTTYGFEKACETADLVMQRRGKKLDSIEKNILEEIFKRTDKYRK
ncbi:MAG: glucose-1-phosphate thymidylyltransferase [Bacteroidetes bacterium]|nr:MAG: glucose-1-phosphate thymidylyltransferase [Bacteroidota bacterium]